MATGEIVAWLNSDDYYFPYAVSTAVRRFQEDPELTLFYGDGVLATRLGHFRGYYAYVEPFDRNRLFSCSDYIMQPTTFFRREALFEVGLLESSLQYVMDWDLWCRFAKQDYRFHYEPRPIAVNRVYLGTKTSTRDWSRLQEIYRLIRRYQTGLWPHGFFGYLLTFIRESNLAGVVKKGAMAMVLMANWRNLTHELRHQRILYGIDGRANNLCASSVTLYLPILRPCRHLLLQLHVPFSKAMREQSADVFVSGSYAFTHKFEFDTGPQMVVVPVGPTPHEARYIQVDLRFLNSTPWRTVRNLYRRQDIACFFKGCQLV